MIEVRRFPRKATALLSCVGLLLASFVCFTATPSRADACRLNTTIAAQGNGHNAACFVAGDGRLEVVEYGVYDPIDANHDGSDALIRDIRGAPTHVTLDPQGNLTFESMERIVTAFADYYGIDVVNVSHFPEADDIQNALTELDKMKAEISVGQKYNMFRRNCDDIASKLIIAAGANAVATGLIPNLVSNEERRGEAGKRIAAGDWSGKWQRDAAGNWNFRAGQ